MWNPARRAEAGANATNQPHAPQIIRQSTTAGPCTPRSWGRGLGERGRGLRAPLSRCHPGPDMGQCMVSVYRLRGHVIHAYYGLDHAMGLGFMATRRQRIQVVMATPGTQMRDSARCGGDGAANGCGPSPPTPPQNTGTSSRHSRRREVDNCTTIRSITRPMIRRATLTRRVLVLLRARAGGGGWGEDPRVQPSSPTKMGAGGCALPPHSRDGDPNGGPNRTRTRRPITRKHRSTQDKCGATEGAPGS